ncbi:MAG: TIM barrel protein [Acidobacteria bacterium]|nr:TIM barrel protein [Acidobacteriota bacterium]MCA1650362.1 TIM barrel protein [Acidobacteriota bacterium]
MDRRSFVQSALAIGAGLASPIAVDPVIAGARDLARGGTQPRRKFKLGYAPHFGMFRQHAGADAVAELEFMAAEGFTALEDNGMRGRAVDEQERIGAALDRLRMRMGVFVAHTINWNEPTLTTPDAAIRETFLKEIRESVDIAKRVNAKWMTVVPGHVDRRPHLDYQTAQVVETLKRAAAILEPHSLIMVLEPLNTLRNHPGMFLREVPQAYLVCKAVASPSCKILFDMYHQQITEGNLIPNIDAAWDEVAYFQVGDNPGRKEPGTGEINYRNVFRHIHAKGFTGVVGMEHGNAQPGREGERAVIDAYIAADSWT